MLNACAYIHAYIDTRRGTLVAYVRSWVVFVVFFLTSFIVCMSFWPVLIFSFNLTCYFIFYSLHLFPYLLLCLSLYGFGHWPLYLDDDDFLLSFLITFTWLYHFCYVVFCCHTVFFPLSRSFFLPGLYPSASEFINLVCSFSLFLFLPYLLLQWLCTVRARVCMNKWYVYVCFSAQRDIYGPV